MPELKICYHDHCFDGVASAATFLRFYRDRVKPGLSLDDVAFQGLAHRAGGLFGDELFSGRDNAVLDFRYSQHPKLTWWFDHHQSAFEENGDEAHYRADRSGQKHWDPTAKSCTKFLARVVADKFGWDPSPLKELIDWAELIDGALFPDPQTAVQLREPALQLMLLVEATKDYTLCSRLARALADRPLSSVLQEPWVTEPLVPILARHHEVVRTVSGRVQLDRGVAQFDLADLGIDNVNKFISYSVYPEATYTVSVTKGAHRSKVSLGSNPWRQNQRRHNLAQIAERYGGGGHPAVAAISFEPDRLEDAREAARTIAAELKG